MSQIELTLKPRDVEETIDLYFCRPVGFIITRWLQPTPIHPTHVTLVSIVIGVISGHLLYYDHLAINVAGMISFIIADLLDSVDGQLARLKGMSTRFGRILDGAGGYFVFTSIYLHLALRLFHHGAGWPIFLLAFFALLSQGLQNLMADYYRQAYIVYGVRSAKGELDSATKLRREFEEQRTSGSSIERFLQRTYIDYTARQERFTPSFQRFREILATISLNEDQREHLAARYRRLNRPLIRQNAWIATNLRMLIVFALVFLRRIVWYFWFDIVILNLVMVVLVWLHEKNSRRLLAEIRQ